MDKTVKDLKKVSYGAFGLAKTAMYYGYIPLIIVLGLRTIKWEMLTSQGPPL
jgi:hypothetical protein